MLPTVAIRGADLRTPYGPSPARVPPPVASSYSESCRTSRIARERPWPSTGSSYPPRRRPERFRQREVARTTSARRGAWRTSPAAVASPRPRPEWTAVPRRPGGRAAARHARPTMPLARASGTTCGRTGCPKRGAS